MAATDIRDDLNSVANPFEFQGIKKWVTYDLDVTKEDSGILTVATHNIFNVPLGWAFVEGFGVVKTSFASSGAATVTFGLSDGITSDSLTGALAIAGLAAGDVVNFAHNDVDATAGTIGYAATDGDQIYFTMTVGTEVLTAGRIILCAAFVDIDSMLSMG